MNKYNSINHIFYKDGYKYQLEVDYRIRLLFISETIVDMEYLKLDSNSILTICRGYAWDGPSGLTIDTSTFMRGSLVHDALYQLMREEVIDNELYRKKCDQALRNICIEDGMNRFRAWYVYHAVRIGGDPSADPANKKKVICS